MATKLGRMMTYLDGFLPTMLPDPLPCDLVRYEVPVQEEVQHGGSFACNAKTIAIAIILLVFLYSAFGKTSKSNFQIFLQLLLSAQVTRIRVINMICCVLSSHVF